MINLYEALQAVLLTESKQSDIIDAINKGYRLRITYDDNLYKTLYNKIRYPKGVNPTGERIILPYCLGEDSRSGALVLRAFQESNKATRRGAPKWKYFKLDNITSLQIDKSKPFKWTPKEMGYSNAPEFNTQGDRLMSSIIAIKPIGYSLDDTLAKERAKTEYLQTAPKMNLKDGPIMNASQQRRKSVYTSQPRSKKYAMWAKNIDKDTDLTSQDKLAQMKDVWAKHETGNDENIDKYGNVIQASKNNRGPINDNTPKPNNTTTKPINANTSTKPKTNNNTEEEEDWDEWLNQSHGNEF